MSIKEGEANVSRTLQVSANFGGGGSPEGGGGWRDFSPGLPPVLPLAGVIHKRAPAALLCAVRAGQMDVQVQPAIDRIAVRAGQIDVQA